jgi:hypothetical protein
MAHCQWTQERVKQLGETSDRAFYTLKCDQGRSFLRLFMRSTTATGKYDENELLVSCYDIRSWFIDHVWKGNIYLGNVAEGQLE